MNIVTRYEPYSGTIFSVNQNDFLRKSIFVSIVAYKDENVINSIRSLLENAKRPNNIFISIAAAEFRPDSEPWIQELKNIKSLDKNHFRLSILDCRDNPTFGKLKFIADKEYNKEDYYLSISSRTEFAPYWDDIMIKQLEDLQSNINEDIVVTAKPRSYVPHDDVVDGFVFFTNHKTKKSMQREEYDGAKIPMSGYSNFVNSDNVLLSTSLDKINESSEVTLSEIDNVLENERFLKQFGFVKFSERKFVKDEYVAIASGFLSDFVFCSAKVYLRFNKSNESLVDINQFNFYSFVNLIRNKIKLITFRFIPVYSMYTETVPGVSPDFGPQNFISSKDYEESQGMELINRYLNNYVYEDNEFNQLLAVDWSEKKFKVRDEIYRNSLIDAINSFVSLYNFSTYENTLHWNKRC
jgi:hypothetical protein